MKRILIFALAGVLAISCGGGAAKLEIKMGEKSVSLAVRSSGSDRSVKTFTDKESKVTTATTFTAMMANFDMETTNIATMKKPLTAPEQVRLMLQLVGEEGTNKDSELKPGTYKADPTSKYMKVDTVTVTTFAGGKEVNTNFDTMFSGSKITGEVKVTSVTAGEISGEIDVTEGDRSVKGTFSAKISPRK